MEISNSHEDLFYLKGVHVSTTYYLLIINGDVLCSSNISINFWNSFKIDMGNCWGGLWNYLSYCHNMHGYPISWLLHYNNWSKKIKLWHLLIWPINRNKQSQNLTNKKKHVSSTTKPCKAFSQVGQFFGQNG